MSLTPGFLFFRLLCEAACSCDDSIFYGRSVMIISRFVLFVPYDAVATLEFLNRFYPS